MARRISQAGLSFIETWEELVLYVYDDKVPKRRIGGVLKYPEWDGGPVRGTLTIGYGHTDAAGAPKITQGMRITEDEANRILDQDLAPCQRAVNAAIKVPIGQHQFDTLTSTEFNCPSALPAVARLINSGQSDQVPRKLLQYTHSGGEFMQGLLNRRNGEIKLWNTPDDPEAAAVNENFAPQAEQEPPPKTMAGSKTGAASMTIGAGGVVATIQAANDAAAPIESARDNLKELGLLDWLAAAAHSPAALVGIAIVALAVFVWFDRRRRLQADHV